MKKILGIFSAAIVFLFVLIGIFNESSFSIVDLAVHTVGPGILHDRMNMIYNSSFVWRESLFISDLSSPISRMLNNPLHAPFVISLTFIFSGATAYFSRKSGALRISDILLSASITLSILFILGCDSLIMQTLSFSFWLMLVTDRFFKQRSVVSLDIAAFLAVLFLISETGNQFAFVTALFCFSVFFFFRGRDWQRAEVLHYSGTFNSIIRYS